MAGMDSKSRRLSMNLSPFTFTESPTKSSIKSPKNFEEPNGVVGLGILAAMNSNSNDEYCSQDPFFKKNAMVANSPRSVSNPIPILSSKESTSFSAKSDKSAADIKRMSVEEMELCEEYTCVISHIGENQIMKKEYFANGDFLGSSTNIAITATEKISADNNNSIGHGVSSGVVSAGPVSRGGETPTFPVADFLNTCFLCKKQLHGLDIFMYRANLDISSGNLTPDIPCHICHAEEIRRFVAQSAVPSKSPSTNTKKSVFQEP